MNSSSNLHLVLDPPSEILFDFSCSAVLFLINNRDYPVAFKAESNDPLRYSINPRVGTISSQSSVAVRINIIMKDMQNKIHTQNTFQKDQFSVQAVRLPENFGFSPFSDLSQFQQIWTSISKFQKGQSNKLKAKPLESIPPNQQAIGEKERFNEEKIQKLERKVEKLSVENQIWKSRYHEVVGIKEEPNRKFYPPLSEDKSLKVKIVPAGIEKGSIGNALLDFIGDFCIELLMFLLEIIGHAILQSFGIEP